MSTPHGKKIAAVMVIVAGCVISSTGEISFTCALEVQIVTRFYWIFESFSLSSLGLKASLRK